MVRHFLHEGAFSYTITGLLYYVYLMGTITHAFCLPNFRTVRPGAFVCVVVSIIILPVSVCLLSDTRGINNVTFKFDLVRLVSGYVSSTQTDHNIMTYVFPRPAHVLHVLLTARVILHARQQANESYIQEISSSFFTQSY